MMKRPLVNTATNYRDYLPFLRLKSSRNSSKSSRLPSTRTVAISTDMLPLTQHYRRACYVRHGAHRVREDTQAHPFSTAIGSSCHGIQSSRLELRKVVTAVQAGIARRSNTHNLQQIAKEKPKQEEAKAQIAHKQQGRGYNRRDRDGGL